LTRAAGQVRDLPRLLRRLCYVGFAAIPIGLTVGFNASLNSSDPAPGGARAEIRLATLAILIGAAAGIVLGVAGISGQRPPAASPFRLRQGLQPLARRLAIAVSRGMLRGFAVGLVFWMGLGLAYGLAGEMRIAAAPPFPPGSTGTGHVPGGRYADYPDGLRYVIPENGNRYVVTIRKAAFYVEEFQDRPYGFFYPSQPYCTDYLQQCRAHSPETLKYTSLAWSSYLIAVTLPDGTRLIDVAPEPPGISSWLNPPTTGNLIATIINLGYSAALFVVLPVALVGGLLVWLDIPAAATQAISPPSTLRTDLMATVFRGTAIPVLTMPPAAVVILHITSSGGSAVTETASMVTLGGTTIGLLAISLSSWSRLQVARIWLAARGDAPWHLMRFLADAHARGALRQAGAAYQFRHSRLQDRLATQRVPRNYRRDLPAGEHSNSPTLDTSTATTDYHRK
jgi:hypothetical protein